jgi:uncharacterized membrane protein
MTNKVSKKTHHRFGYVASFLFLMHVVASVATLYSDFVHHHTASKIIHFQSIAQASLYFIASIITITKGDIETHRNMLVKSYLNSI